MPLDLTGSNLFFVLALFGAGLFCIMKGGDLFVDAATWIAESTGIPKFIIGATVVSFATTMPELLVSLFSAFEGNADIAVGNAVGSVTANTGLILCISLVCMQCVMTRRQYAGKACLLLSAICLLFVFTRDGSLSLWESAAILAVFVFYMAESLLAGRREQGAEQPAEKPKKDGRTVAWNIGKFVLGAAAIGGCCGITPAHIRELARTIKPLMRAEKQELPKVEIVECDLKEPVPLAEKSSLGAKLAAGKFVTSVEITPPRGFDLASTVAGARKCKEAGIDAVNLPDGPRASARISPFAAAVAIQQQVGIETVLHCCCRDKSVIGLQADLLGCAGMGINNILFITGDPPKLGDYPFSSGVFDVDSIGLVKIQSRMNRGIDLGGKSISAPTRAVIGVGADPSAIDLEREYRRTCEKVEAGAEFIITQPVFAIETLFAFLDRIAHLKTPLIAGIWPLVSYRNAEFMKTEVPGVVVPDAVMKRMAAAGTKEEQREAGLEIARESIAAIRDRVQGIQVSAPFGNVDLALRVLK